MRDSSLPPSPLPRAALLLLLCPLLAVNIWCGFSLHRLASRRTEIKKDAAEINSLRQGLMSVDSWKGIIQQIAGERIREFKLTKEQDALLTDALTRILNALIVQADRIIQNPRGPVSGIQRMGANAALTVARKNVRVFARTILDEVKKPATFTRLKDMALERFNAFADGTHGDPAGAVRVKALLTKYGAQTAGEFNAAAEGEAARLQAKSYAVASIFLATVLLFLAAWWTVRERPELHRTLYGLSVVLAFVLLSTSLITPMIEIDARIQRMDFTLVGEHVRFDDQVLYYRNNTLLQLVQKLLKADKADSLVVGLLVLVFSILFPVSKLISTELYLWGDERVRRNRLVNFLAFQSGKWSMADVAVVAIFMAYLGFNGIVEGQLKSLNLKTDFLESITTNATSLQPGFVLFTTFVFYGLALSEILKRIAGEPAVHSAPTSIELKKASLFLKA